MLINVLLNLFLILNNNNNNHNNNNMNDMFFYCSSLKSLNNFKNLLKI